MILIEHSLCHFVRAPVLTINGAGDGFDGVKIGLGGFGEGLMELKSSVGAGCKLKLGESGDILVKRVGEGEIFTKNLMGDTAVSNDILKLPRGLLPLDRAFRLFDMKKFRQNMNRELKRPTPDRRKIENQVGNE